MTELLRSEWIKFRSVRGLVIGLLLAPILTVVMSVLTSSGSQCGWGFQTPSGQQESGGCSAPTGPGGELVQDTLYFAHEPLTGNGSITVRMTGLTSSALQPWAKSGIIIKANTVPGSAYAAMMVTGAHGVRMEWNYTQDTAGMPGGVSAATPRWLRLVRAGDTITGYDSADGTHWTKVGIATLAGLPPTVQVGMFAATPSDQVTANSSAAITATGTFGHVSIAGTGTGGTWAGTSVNSGPPNPPGQSGPGGFQQTSTGFTVTGQGDIAPDVPGNSDSTGTPISHTLDGVLVGLIVVIVVGAIFITAEYRRGMIRTTFAASPARGKVLAAKAIVLGSLTFVAALIACAIAIPLATHQLRNGGNVVDPLTTLTWLRVVIGTAAVFAAAAMLALALGAIFRRGAAAVCTAIVLIVVPYFLAVALPNLPGTLADWLMRITPTAAMAVQQTIPRYQQVPAPYSPTWGFFPLSPLAGFAVLCAWTGGALWLAAYLLNRRDA
jgi:ABC-type transport system involved in multi-copper enzyme maturation permease subunit